MYLFLNIKQFVTALGLHRATKALPFGVWAFSGCGSLAWLLLGMWGLGSLPRG